MISPTPMSAAALMTGCLRARRPGDQRLPGRPLRPGFVFFSAIGIAIVSPFSSADRVIGGGLSDAAAGCRYPGLPAGPGRRRGARRAVSPAQFVHLVGVRRGRGLTTGTAGLRGHFPRLPHPRIGLAMPAAVLPIRAVTSTTGCRTPVAVGLAGNRHRRVQHRERRQLTDLEPICAPPELNPVRIRDAPDLAVPRSWMK